MGDIFKMHQLHSHAYHAWRHQVAIGSVILTLALSVGMLSACGQTGASGPPDTLTITIATLGSSATQTFAVRDSATVQHIYQHVLALPVIPPNAGPACRVTRESYRFAFSASGTEVLTVGIGQCANMLQMPNNQTRAPDATFWSMLDSAVGQRIDPD